MLLATIQARLTRFGFTTGGTLGRMTAQTQDAVRAFQRAYNGPGAPLAIDGDPGPLTQKAMEYLPLLSPHFSVWEVACKHCRQVGSRRELFGSLEVLRNRMASPLVLVSAYRCATHNKNVGGAPMSMHLLGAGVDIDLFRSPVSLSLARTVRQFSGIGTRNQGRSASHLDVRHLMGAQNLTPNATTTNPAIWPYD